MSEWIAWILNVQVHIQREINKISITKLLFGRWFLLVWSGNEELICCVCNKKKTTDKIVIINIIIGGDGDGWTMKINCLADLAINICMHWSIHRFHRVCHRVVNCMLYHNRRAHSTSARVARALACVYDLVCVCVSLCKVHADMCRPNWCISSSSSYVQCTLHTAHCTCGWIEWMQIAIKMC